MLGYDMLLSSSAVFSFFVEGCGVLFFSSLFFLPLMHSLIFTGSERNISNHLQISSVEHMFKKNTRRLVIGTKMWFIQDCFKTNFSCVR